MSAISALWSSSFGSSIGFRGCFGSSTGFTSSSLTVGSRRLGRFFISVAISSVIKPGYRILIRDDKFNYIKNAEVEIFELEKK